MHDRFMSSMNFRFSANELSEGEIKRKKLAAHSVQTGSQTALAHIDEEATSLQPEQQHQPATNNGADVVLSEHYWRDQAEAHRLELERHLQQNEKLHNVVRHFKMRLQTANQQLDDSKELVEVLTEMLEEDEPAATTDDATSMEVGSADESSQDESIAAENTTVDK